MRENASFVTHIIALKCKKINSNENIKCVHPDDKATKNNYIRLCDFSFSSLFSRAYNLSNDTVEWTWMQLKSVKTVSEYIVELSWLLDDQFPTNSLWFPLKIDSIYAFLRPPWIDESIRLSKRKFQTSTIENKADEHEQNVTCMLSEINGGAFTHPFSFCAGKIVFKPVIRSLSAQTVNSMLQ